MLTEELLDLAKRIVKQKAETQTLELKAAHQGCPKRLYDTLSSFSNQDMGGILVFGIDETKDFAVVGIYDAQDLQKKVTEQCQQMEPPVRAVFTLASVDDNTICSAEIPGLDLSERPCYYKGAGRLKGSYIRVGDADLPMTEYELYSYEAFRKHLHDDERVMERAEMSMMDSIAINRYVEDKSIGKPGFAKLDKPQLLELLNITHNNVPTLAAVMNFALYPQAYYPQFAITAIVVPGTQIGDVSSDAARFLDNMRIEGTISEMAEAAINFCKRNMKVRTIIDSRTGKRVDRTEYPIEAIREAVLNALIHRDYSIYTEGTPIQIDFFTDRLEIHSPGNLYGRMSVDQLGIARPDLRNPALAIMAEALTGSENRYSGIPTMRRAMEAYGLPAPKFENRRNEFVVTFYNSNGLSAERIVDKKDEGSSSLLEFCATPRTRKEIADFLGVKTTFYAMQHYVKPLLESGQMAMTIPGKPKAREQKYYRV